MEKVLCIIKYYSGGKRRVKDKLRLMDRWTAFLRYLTTQYNRRMGQRTKNAGGDGRNSRQQSQVSRPNQFFHGVERWFRDNLPNLAVCAFLLLAIVAVFGQTARYDFTDCDDNQYVTENPQVMGGVSVEGVVWAFTRSHASNWHPLTWLSHMLDCEFYGLEHPGGHHLTNVILHAANTILLFLLLRQLICDLWASAFVAALFAIHPLHVESVAWIAERKDVLSGLLFMLTLAAYVGYARREFSLARYLLVTVLLALGLLAKPMLVTLPFVLLLLDFWPLGRFGRGWSIVGEKLPWIALSACCCVMTFIAQRAGNAVVPLRLGPLWVRITNAVVAYAGYLVQFFWPLNLAVLYPHPGPSLPIWKIVASCLLLLGISAWAIAWRRKRPYLLVGWLWYLGMLVPVIGIVQVGGQAMADRYTYLTQIGLCIALALGMSQAAGDSPSRRRMYWISSALAVLVLGICASRQATYWRNTETVLRHALACTKGNFVSHYALAAWLERHDRMEEAIVQYEKGSDIDPLNVATQNHIGTILANRGRIDDAIVHFGKALDLKPDDAETCNNIGRALITKGRPDLAIIGFEKALAAKPGFADAENNLGTALLKTGHVDAAIAHYQRAVQINPSYMDARHNLAVAQAMRDHNDAESPVREPPRSPAQPR